jgi:Uma2 family endonuclease
MNIALRRTMSVAEFLAWEERQELRYEFDGARPVAITGGTLRHNRICLNLVLALSTRLRGGSCQAFGPDVKVIVNEHVRYPDVFVTCSPQTETATVAERPVVVFEVISESTARVDRVEKLKDYLAAPSIMHYVIIEQAAKIAVVQTRDGDRWITWGASDGEMIELPAIGVHIPVADLYEGVETLAGQDQADDSNDPD